MVYLNGLMEENIKEIGKTVNSMELECMWDLMGKREKVNGLMENELNGQKRMRMTIRSEN